MTTVTGSATSDNLFFRAIVDGYVTNNPCFLRRDWLAEEVAARMAEPDCRFVFLTAEPGVGKSTFMAQLAADHPSWLRYFIRRDQRTPLGDVGAKSFLLRIGYQLAALHPDLFTQEGIQLSVEQRIGEVEAKGEVVGAEVKRILATPFFAKAVEIRQHVQRNAGRIVGLKLEELVIETRQLDAGDLQYMALLDPARALLECEPSAQIVVLIDALDEIRYHPAEDNILKWLTNCPELPPNVHFVLSSRPPDDALKVFYQKQAPTLRSLTITPEDLRVQLDVEAYVRRLATRPDVGAELAQRNIGTDAFVGQAVDKANGNIGYLDALERAIDAALARPDDTDRTMLRALLDLSRLPDELGALNGFFMRQIKTAVAGKVRTTDPETGETIDFLVWPEVYSRILGVLAVALAPLELDEITALGGIKADRVYAVEAMNWLLQFLDIEARGYRFYHATLPEFLTASATKEHVETTDLWIDATDWNRKIANYYWRTYRKDWRRCDVYGLNSLTTHIARSSQPERLRELIDQDWMAARFEGSGYAYDGFVADVDLAWLHAHDKARRQIAVGKEDMALADCVRYALIRAKTNSLSAGYAPELIERALETGIWRPERALSVADHMTDALSRFGHHRACMLAVVLASGAGPPLSPDLQRKAVALGIEEILYLIRLPGYQQIEPLSALAFALYPHLTPDQRVEILNAANSIEDSFWRAKALIALTPLTPFLSAELLEEMLETARATEGPGWLARTLAALVPKSSDEQRPEVVRQVLTEARASNSDWELANTLVALAEYLTGQSLVEALELAQTIDTAVYRAQALAVLAPRLDEEARHLVLAQAWDAAKVIDSEPELTMTLAILAPFLSNEQRLEVLKSAEAIEDQYWRAQALVALVPHLSTSVRDQVLDEALDRKQLQVLISLARHLTGERLSRALSMTRQAGCDLARFAHALTVLAPNLPSALRSRAMTQVLAAIHRMSDDLFDDITIVTPLFVGEPWPKAHALAAVAPYLTDPQLDQALNIAKLIAHEGTRAAALIGMAPYLNGELLTQAQAAAKMIEDEELQLEVMTALTSKSVGQPESEVKEAEPFIETQPTYGGMNEPWLQMIRSDLQSLELMPEDLPAIRAEIADGLWNNFRTETPLRVLDFCANHKLFAQPVLSAATLTAIANHIIEICEDWNWL